MEQNSLVKEITPEEVKSLDPFEISYIAMKDGSIIMVLEKNDNLENNIQIKKTILKNNEKSEKKEKSGQNSPNFNLSGKKHISFIKTKIEEKENQKEIKNKNEIDYNVYYSNTKNKSYDINNDNDNLDNMSFYSNDDIYKKSSNNIKVEYVYRNGNNEYTNTNFENKENDINNIGSKTPYYIVKRKYYFCKKTDNENKPKNETNNLNKTYSYNIPSEKGQNNLYTYKSHNINNNINNDNMSLKYSKYSIDKNINNINNNINNKNFIRNSDYKANNNTYINTYENISQRSSNKYSETNNTYNNMNTLNNTNTNLNNEYYDNYHYYEMYYKPKYENFDINNYSFKNNQNHTVHSIVNTKNDNLSVDKKYSITRTKTPLYTVRDLKRKGNNDKKKVNKKNNLELKKCLTKDNHKYYERKELSAPKKLKSNYIKMKDFNGKTIHVFENK